MAKTMEARIRRDIEKAGWKFKINDLNETIFARKGDGPWVEMSEAVEARVRLDMRDDGYGGREKPGLGAMRDTVIVMADDARYNPILEWLDSLGGQYAPNSQQTPYLIPQFARYFTNPDKMLGTWLFKWLVGAIAKIFSGERNPMWVIVGPQTIGKSYVIKWLCAIGEDYFNRTELAYTGKDKLIEMSEMLLMEIEELDATTARATVGTLKAIITKDFIRVRPPYGKRPVRKNVPVSFAGTVNYNEAGFLNDPSGLTRFLTNEITAIDWAYTDMSAASLWAEALWFYRNVPNCWRLTRDEVNKQRELNEQFEQISPMLDFIEAYFDVTGKEEDFTAAHQIRGIAINKGYRVSNEKAFDMELGAAMTRLGLRRTRQRVDGRFLRGYSGIRIGG